MAKRSYDSFEEFWPFYVAMHAKAATRWVHLAGTLTGLAVSGYGLARGRARYAAALPLIGYGTAWPAHFLIERNNPATFGHPAWSLRGDVKMIVTMLAGRDAELAETAAKWLAENGGRGSAAGPATATTAPEPERPSEAGTTGTATPDRGTTGTNTTGNATSGAATTDRETTGTATTETATTGAAATDVAMSGAGDAADAAGSSAEH